jgi:hypothetical protein
MGMLQMQKEQDNFSSHVVTENSSTLYTSQSRYPTSHTFAKKCPLLNSLNIDLMDQSEGTKGILSQMQMDNLLREIFDFKKEHKEQVSFESLNSAHKNKLFKVPTVTEKEFSKKEK